MKKDNNNGTNLILLTGIPATGKTTMGNYLANNYGFLHIDFEDGISIKQFEQDPRKFLAALNQYQKVVISWGFVPIKKHILLVEFLISQSYKHIWFQGDYLTSLITFIKRDRVGNLAYYLLQVTRIHFSKIVEKMSPQVVHVFNDSAGFRKQNDILKDIGIK